MLLILMMAPLSAAAEAFEVKFGAMVDAVYDTNVFRTSSNKKDDGSFRFTPTIEIEAPGRKLSGDLYYAPTYEVFTTYTDASDFTHDVRNNIDWLPSEKTQVGLTNRFQAVDVLNYGDPNTIDEGTSPVPDNDIARERIHLFGSALGIEHAISPRWTSSSSVNFSLFNSERRLTADSKSVSGFQSFNYGLTAADRVGGGGGFTAQFYDDVLGLPASNTYVYQLFGSYSRNFGERTTLSIRVGPALIHTVQDDFSASASVPTYPGLVLGDPMTFSQLTSNENFPVKDEYGQNLAANPGYVIPAGSYVVPDASSCDTDADNPVLLEGSRCASNRLLRNDPAFADEYQAVQTILAADEFSEVEISGSNDGSNDMQWTVFGEVSLSHLWLPTLVSTVSYNRRESPARGLGAGAVEDGVQFLTTWRPSELWDLSFQASYVRRESPTNLSRTFIQVDLDDATGGTNLVMANGLQTVIEADSGVDTHRWGIVLRAARRITRRLSASMRFSYSDQTSQYTSRSPNDFTNFLAVVGVKYDFDPFRF